MYIQQLHTHTSKQGLQACLKAGELLSYCQLNTHTHTIHHHTSNTTGYSEGTNTVSGEHPLCLKPDTLYRSWRLRSHSLMWVVAVPTVRTTAFGILACYAFSHCRHLPNLRVCDWRCSPTSASLLSLFQGIGVMSLDLAAIEVEGATMMTSHGEVSSWTLRSLLDRRVMIRHMPCKSLFLWERQL